MVSSVPRKRRERGFELLVHGLRSADEAHRGHAVSVTVDARDARPRGSQDGWQVPGTTWASPAIRRSARRRTAPSTATATAWRRCASSAARRPCTSSSRPRCRASSAPRTPSSIRRAGTPTAGCSRPCSASRTPSSPMRSITPASSTASGSARRGACVTPTAISPSSSSTSRTRRTAARASSPPTACSRWTAASRRSREICDLADRYGALVMVDDSHATGFMGAGGRGTPEHCGVAGRIDFLTGTFGKALGGGSGGYTRGRADAIAWLRQRSRPYLFSNSIPPVVAAVTLRALDLVENMPQLRGNVVRARAQVPRRHAGRGLQTTARRAPHHPGDDRRRRARGAFRRPAARRRRVRHRILVPGRADGRGAHPHADVAPASPTRSSNARSRPSSRWAASWSHQ